jgi:acetoin utilization protein AcuB
MKKKRSNTMIVGERMTTPIIAVSPDLTLPEAFKLMKQEDIRRLVVVKSGKMVGLVTKNDLENAMPSKATSLSIWEINYLIDKITVGEVMVKDVITIPEDTPIEEAACIMADNKIGSLPVMRGEEVVGIISETDLFHIFLEMFGSREKGVRVTAGISDEPGSLAKLSKAIFEAGGDIISIGSYEGDVPTVDMVTVKVCGVEQGKLRDAIEPFVVKLTDIREV